MATTIRTLVRSGGRSVLRALRPCPTCNGNGQVGGCPTCGAQK